jgi:hypothetical protein
MSARSLSSSSCSKCRRAWSSIPIHSSLHSFVCIPYACILIYTHTCIHTHSCRAHSDPHAFILIYTCRHYSYICTSILWYTRIYICLSILTYTLSCTPVLIRLAILTFGHSVKILGCGERYLRTITISWHLSSVDWSLSSYISSPSFVFTISVPLNARLLSGWIFMWTQ